MLKPTRIVPTIHEVFEDIGDGLFDPNHWQEVSCEDAGVHGVSRLMGNHCLLSPNGRCLKVRFKRFLTKSPVDENVKCF